MTIRTHVPAAAAAIGSFAAPAAAQYYPQQPAYPQDEQQYQQEPQPQPYAGQPDYGYAQQGYNQGYAAQDRISQIINSLLGNRYDVSDRQAVSQCASATMSQATAQYGHNGYAGSDGYAGYAGAYRPGATASPAIRVSPHRCASVRSQPSSAVQRNARQGLIDTGIHYRGGYGGQAYQGAGAGGQAYATRYPRHDDCRSAAISITAGSSPACALTATTRPTAASNGELARHYGDSLLNSANYFGSAGAAGSMTFAESTATAGAGAAAWTGIATGAGAGAATAKSSSRNALIPDPTGISRSCPS